MELHRRQVSFSTGAYIGTSIVVLIRKVLKDLLSEERENNLIFKLT
jgi:hypothetical protein